MSKVTLDGEGSGNGGCPTSDDGTAVAFLRQRGQNHEVGVDCSRSVGAYWDLMISVIKFGLTAAWKDMLGA